MMVDYQENRLIIFVNHLIQYKLNIFQLVMDFPLILNKKYYFEYLKSKIFEYLPKLCKRNNLPIS